MRVQCGELGEVTKGGTMQTREEVEAIDAWQRAERQKKIEDKAKQLGCDRNLAEYINSLEAKLDDLKFELDLLRSRWERHVHGS
jgi:hypothetical protein